MQEWRTELSKASGGSPCHVNTCSTNSLSMCGWPQWRQWASTTALPPTISPTTSLLSNYLILHAVTQCVRKLSFCSNRVEPRQIIAVTLSSVVAQTSPWTVQYLMLFQTVPLFVFYIFHSIRTSPWCLLARSRGGKLN